MLIGLCRISGHSMMPLFMSGDKVIVSRLPYFFAKPKINDVIVFNVNGKKIIKRIKKIDEDRVLTIGDNKGDSREFGWIENKKILGKVIKKL